MLDFLLEAGKQFGFVALIVCAIGAFFYQLYKSQANTINDYIANERKEKQKLTDILDNTVKIQGEQMYKISSTLERIELNMSNNNFKISNIETKLNTIDEKIIHIEVKMDKK